VRGRDRALLCLFVRSFDSAASRGEDQRVALAVLLIPFGVGSEGLPLLD
jgi:hypothetical protein